MDDDTPKPKRRKSLTNGTCLECGHGFMFEAVKGRSDPDLCGELRCRAMRWSPDEWEGRARMADARRSSGQHLDDLDRLALDRFPHPTHITRPPSWPQPVTGVHVPAYAT